MFPGNEGITDEAQTDKALDGIEYPGAFFYQVPDVLVVYRIVDVQQYQFVSGLPGGYGCVEERFRITSGTETVQDFGLPRPINQQGQKP